MITNLSSSFLSMLLLAGVIGLIIAMHLIKPRVMRSAVSSLLIWNAAAKSAHQRTWNWRWWLALGLSLVIGILLVLLLTRPELQGRGEGAIRTVVIIDNSPSMVAQAKDGRSRFYRARAIARGLIADANGPVMVLDTMGRVPVLGFTEPVDALTTLERIDVVRAGHVIALSLPDVPGLVSHLVSDGVAPINVTDNTVVHSVFEAVDNVALLGLAAHSLPTDPARVEALVQIVNASTIAKEVRLTLRGEGGYSISQSLQMRAGERIDATFDVSAFGGGVLAAAVRTRDDAVPDDDIAYTVVEHRRDRRVVLVSRGNAMLADALSALDGVRVEVIPPAQYRDGMDADVLVFDDYTPERAPSAGALLFRPRSVAWLPTSGKRIKSLSAVASQRNHSLAQGVQWRDLSATGAMVWTQSSTQSEAIVLAGEDAVVLAGTTKARWIAVGFRPGDSNLPLQGGFPVFLGNALAHLNPREVTMTQPLGPIRVRLPSGQVRDGRGALVASRHVDGDTLFDAERPDIYSVRGDAAQMRVTAMVLDPESVEVNRSRFSSHSAAIAASTALPIQRWALAILMALAVLFLDWAGYVRRITR